MTVGQRECSLEEACALMYSLHPLPALSGLYSSPACCVSHTYSGVGDSSLLLTASIPVLTLGHLPPGLPLLGLRLLLSLHLGTYCANTVTRRLGQEAPAPVCLFHVF